MAEECYSNEGEPNINLGFGGGLYVLGKDRVHVYDPECMNEELLSFPYQGLIELVRFVNKNYKIVNARFEAEKASYRGVRNLVGRDE